MKKLKRTIEFLKSNEGFAGQYIAMTVAILSIIMVMLIGFAGYDGIHQYSNLDIFADEMAQTVANSGKTTGINITEKYNQLSRDTGLSPNISYNTDYYNSSQKTVQYGDTIELTATVTIQLQAFGDLKVPLDLKVTKTVQSRQYWK